MARVDAIRSGEVREARDGAAGGCGSAHQTWKAKHCLQGVGQFCSMLGDAGRAATVPLIFKNQIGTVRATIAFERFSESVRDERIADRLGRNSRPPRRSGDEA